MEECQPYGYLYEGPSAEDDQALMQLLGDRGPGLWLTDTPPTWFPTEDPSGSSDGELQQDPEQIDPKGDHGAEHAAKGGTIDPEEVKRGSAAILGEEALSWARDYRPDLAEDYDAAVEQFEGDADEAAVRWLLEAAEEIATLSLRSGQRKRPGARAGLRSPRGSPGSRRRR